MVTTKFGGKQTKTVYKLRNRAAFESFVAQNRFCIIVAYHYLCPDCDKYIKLFKNLSAEYRNEEALMFGKIHIQLSWMIKKAKLEGDVEEENVFLRDYGVGKAVPATLFFDNGNLVWKIEGLLSPPIFRGLVKKLQEGVFG